MKFVVEKKGQTFLVVNQDTTYVKGRYKTEGEAKLHAEKLQKEHNDGIKMASAKLGTEREDLSGVE